MPKAFISRTYLFAILLLAAGAVHSGDGVLEINQACRNDGCVPGDSPGTPIEITEPGSYVLTSDLAVNVNSSGIVIDTHDVVLDLNGYAIRGPVLCSGSPASCNQSGVGAGISADNNENITIRNGTVRGVGANGIDANGPGSRILNVTVTENAGIGLALGPAGSGSIARDVRATRNGDTGIAGGLVIDSAAIDNGTFGLALSYCSNSLMSGNNNGNSCTAILPNQCDDPTDCD